MLASMDSLETTLSDLARRYAGLHAQKEDLFWSTKMGLAEDADQARQNFQSAEQAWHGFLQDPARLEGLRQLERGAASAPPSQRRVLGGWLAMFAAHVIESPEGRRLSAEIIGLEGELDRQRRAMPLGYVDPTTGQLTRASSVQLALMLRSDPDEARRKAAFEGLASIEGYVLAHGFLDIVKKRNQLARLLGHEDYYAWRVAVVERMTKQRLFGLLDELAQSTREPMLRELQRFGARHGEHALEPWNFGYLRLGKTTRALDPYLPFAPALGRWMAAFHALGVRLRGATLTLDLVDRPGKYENGFMHGPGIAFFDHGTWQPARINFSANAVVGQVGAGMQATRTLFHEGGHAAHFSNIVSDAPCFAQEFAPTSVAYAETQSMFLDSLLEDGEWLSRYAPDAAGAPPPLELLEARNREEQPFRGWDVRAMFTVPSAERAL
jgi:Zn-dependent oligopeptidase